MDIDAHQYSYNSITESCDIPFQIADSSDSSQ